MWVFRGCFQVPITCSTHICSYGVYLVHFNFGESPAAGDKGFYFRTVFAAKYYCIFLSWARLMGHRHILYKETKSALFLYDTP